MSGKSETSSETFSGKFPGTLFGKRSPDKFPGNVSGFFHRFFRTRLPDVYSSRVFRKLLRKSCPETFPEKSSRNFPEKNWPFFLDAVVQGWKNEPPDFEIVLGNENNCRWSNWAIPHDFCIEIASRCQF